MRRHPSISGTTWNRSSITADYQENVTYDGNGNILTYGRNGAAPTAQTIDSLTYHYSKNTAGKLNNNRLIYISDAVANSNYTGDITNQTNTTNYRYDAIGNLIYDAQSGITGNGGVNSIKWSVYGKIQKIYKATDSISYTYNPAGQRVSKTAAGLTTYYVRDAQGNPLAVYDNAHSNLNWKEQQLYGSSRLGMWTPNVNLTTNNAVAVWDTIGGKQYELDNHLGNVLATVTDKRLQHTTNTTSIDFYLADVSSAQDYYPFGMLMPGRQTSTANYRYGFNGKENDNEVKGLGEQQDYGMRIYDPRVGRFLSVDPLYKNFPWNSSYSFAENDVIRSIDLDGLEKYVIYQRSFAPWKYFGEAFGYKYSGDNRGFTVSTSNEIHSKVSTAITLDLNTATAKLNDAIQHGNTTRFDAKTGKAIESAPNVVPGVMLWKPQKSGSEITVQARLEGKAPFSPIPFMDFAKSFFNDPIVWTGKLTISNHIAEGFINVKYFFTGKGFPALETFLEDPQGTKVFIGIFQSPPKSEIIQRLSSPEIASAFTFLTKIITDKSGNFIGVSEIKNGKEVIVKPDEYNKDVQKNSPAKDLPKQ